MQATQQRKLIRDEVAQRLRDQLAFLPTLTVHTQQRSHIPEGVDHYANVFFNKGDIQQQGDFRDDAGTLIIRIATVSQRNVDDELDDLGHHIETVIDQSYNLGGIVSDITQTNWHYGMDEQTGHSWLAYIYTVNYSTTIGE